MADWDTSSPADNDIISQFPANERASRTAVRDIVGVEHETQDNGNQGRHLQTTLLELPEPMAVVGAGILYVKPDGNLWFKNSDDEAIQLTFGALPGGDNALPLPVQSVSPMPIDGGWLYTREFEGTAELYYLDSDDNEIRMTYKGELVVNLSRTDVTVGSLRTRTFMRGNVVDLFPVAGQVVIDWRAATVYRIYVTEDIDVIFENMPETAQNEEQCIYIDLYNGGAFVINVVSTYVVEWPGRTVPAFTVGGRDYILAASNNGTSITAVAILDIGEGV